MYSERTRLRLQDIVDDAQRTELFLGSLDVNAFRADERTLLAVERLLQRMTEAVLQIGAEDMARVATGIPHEQVRGFGNMLRHQYRDIDARVVYVIAREDVPVLAAAAARALEAG